MYTYTYDNISDIVLNNFKQFCTPLPVVYIAKRLNNVNFALGSQLSRKGTGARRISEHTLINRAEKEKPFREVSNNYFVLLVFVYTHTIWSQIRSKMVYPANSISLFGR